LSNPLKAHLRVERTAPDDVQNRQIYVRLNGALLATMMFGRVAELEIEPGEYRLEADNTWKKRTVTFTAQPGERIAFRVASKPGWGYMLLVGFFGAAPIEMVIERMDVREAAG
jgi:hypothetical protein